MTTEERKALVEAAKKATAGEWTPGHFCQEDHPCNCAYVLSENYMGAICTVHSQEGSEENEHNPPSAEAKANQAFIARANPSAILSLEAALTAAEERIGELEAQAETLTAILAVYEGSIQEVERVYKPNKSRSWVLKILRATISAGLLIPTDTKERSDGR